MIVDYHILQVLLIAIFVIFALAIVAGTFSKRTSYSLGALGSACGVAISLAVLLGNGTLSFTLWNITPSSSALIEISSFNAYFLLISSLVWFGTCIYSLRYDDDYSNTLSSLLLLTIVSMILILISGDAILFLVGWESMTIASFFMILEGKGNKRGVLNAAFLFLAFGEGSSVFIMLAFSGIFTSFHTLDFLSASSSIIATDPIASWVFIAALVGFGLKMGIAPFHMSEWLPIAHSSAPSNASALLSATLTLMGVYGLINVVTHLASYELWWGWTALAIGGISTILGALFASASEHTKGLPAYSTIENNGLIVVAVGAYIIASYYNIYLLADLALIAALYHAFAHSISKGSMFVLMGWVSKIKGTFDLNTLGAAVSVGKRATYFAGLFTVLSLAAVPVLAGFVSEWMILEVLFQSFRFGDVGSQIIGTLVGAVAALAAGIIIVAMTKAYGFGVLWSQRQRGDIGVSTYAGTLNEARRSERSALISVSFSYFAALIIGVGVAAPAIFLLASDATTAILHGNVFNSFVTGLLGVPSYFVIISGNPFGGFSPTFTAIFMLGLLTVPFLLSQIGGRWRIRRSTGWFSGLAQPSTSLDTYNSFGYSTPIRIMLRFLFRTKENIVHVGGIRRAVILSPEEYFVELEVLDVFKRFYDILFARWTLAFSRWVGRKFMPGHLSNYLIYIMVAIIFVMLYIYATVL